MEYEYSFSFTECEKSDRGCDGSLWGIFKVNPVTGEYHEMFSGCSGIFEAMLNPFLINTTGMNRREWEETQ